jgi:hypothetical protein
MSVHDLIPFSSRLYLALVELSDQHIVRGGRAIMMAFARVNRFLAFFIALKASIALWMRWFGRVWLLATVILACGVLPACTCSDEKPPPAVHGVIACKESKTAVHVAPALAVREIVPGVMPVSFAVMDSGDAGLSIPIAISPGRNAPDLRVSYSSSAGETSLGVGFSLSVGSAITRCPKTKSLDREQRPIFYDANDSFCIDGQRMVEISRNGQTVEFRTFPDTQIKIVGQVLEHGPAYFEAWLPSGDRIDFGKTPETRPMANIGVPRAWLAGERHDTRGNAIQYNWCFAEDESGYTAEYALVSAHYSAMEGVEPERTVAFVYKTRDDVQTTYSRGMELQHSLQLREIQ